METTTKRGTGSWYTERGTYTEPSEIEGMEWICRLGKRIALVAIEGGAVSDEETLKTFPAGGSSVGEKNLSVGQVGQSRIMARALGRADRGKHNCYAHAGYNLNDEHVCLRCGKPIS